MKYYLGRDGKIYKDYELTRAYYLMMGREISTSEIEDHLDIFDGVVSPVKPSLDDFLMADQKVDAVKFYYDQNNSNPRKRRITLKEAKDIVEKIQKNMSHKKFKNT